MNCKDGVVNERCRIEENGVDDDDKEGVDDDGGNDGEDESNDKIVRDTIISTAPLIVREAKGNLCFIAILATFYFLRFFVSTFPFLLLIRSS